MNFGDKVRMLRKKTGYSQAQLAQALGVSARTVQSYEAGRSLPRSKEVYRRLAGIFGVDLNYLMDDKEEFISEARESYGRRGAEQARKIVDEVAGLFAGGEMAEEDMDEMLRAIQDAYWIAKKNNRKYVPDKYRDSSRRD